MGYHLLKVLTLVFLITYAPHAKSATISEEQKTAIEKGLEAGKALAEALKDGDFRESLVKLGKNLAPFLGVLGPLASIALAFIPTGDSEELTFMKEKFEEVNNKLDIITSEFEEVKNAIDWSTIVVSYGTYERKIRAAEHNLNRIYEVEGQTREHEKNNFINQYESDFDNSVQKLYDVIMNSDHAISKNILEAVIQQTKDHKRQIEQFSLGLVQLLIKGIKVKISYYGMKGWTSDHVTSEWEGNMNELREKLQRMSDDVKARYKTQLKVDADDLILRHHGLGNEGLMQKVYDFVVDKYDWRYWFVAVYDDMFGFDDHTISLCGGYSLLHQQNKNIIISSQDKDTSSFKQSDGNNVLQGVDQDIDACNELKDPGDRARALVDRVSTKVGKSCAPYALRMAVRTGKGLWFISFSKHRSYRKIEKVKRCCWGGGWNKRCRSVTWHHNMIVFG